MEPWAAVRDTSGSPLGSADWVSNGDAVPRSVVSDSGLLDTYVDGGIR